MSSSLSYTRVRCATSPARSQSTGDSVNSDQKQKKESARSLVLKTHSPSP